MAGIRLLSEFLVGPQPWAYELQLGLAGVTDATCIQDRALIESSTAVEVTAVISTFWNLMGCEDEMRRENA